MPNNKILIFLGVMLGFLLSAAQFEKLYADDRKLTPEEVVAKHLESIGKPEVLKSITSRIFKGTSSFEFLQGMHGRSPDGQFLFGSERNKLGLILKYPDLVYPGEYFAFNGQDITVTDISPGQKSPLADFLYRYNDIIKEGLLGGVWSVSWPMLDIEQRKPALKYRVTKIDGQKLHEIEYRPQNLGDLRVKIYFDLKLFRHVRTEYRVRVRNDESTRREGESRRPSVGISRFPGGPDTSEIFDSAPESLYVLVERFSDFRDYKGLTLPAVCSLDYSIEGQGSSLVAHWIMKAGESMVLNDKIPEDFFVAKK